MQKGSSGNNLLLCNDHQVNIWDRSGNVGCKAKNCVYTIKKNILPDSIPPSTSSILPLLFKIVQVNLITVLSIAVIERNVLSIMILATIVVKTKDDSSNVLP